MNPKPLIAFTPGDPAGIGPEIIVAGWAKLCEICVPVVVGSTQSILRAMPFSTNRIITQSIACPQMAKGLANQIDIVEATKTDLSTLDWGKIDARGGICARDSLHFAIDLALEGAVDAIVTGPLHKESLRLAGETHPGHTEILAERCGVKNHAMVLATNEVAVLHATLHMPMRGIFSRLTPELIADQAALLSRLLERLGKGKPRLALPGLNPHAGDGGLFGDEEERILTPGVQLARSNGLDLIGPISPDNVFIRAFDGEFDGIVALYHDQGHIPLKLVGRRRCVNITAGLPIVRTSVAHGTAFDIAGKGIAHPDSLIEATRWAVRLLG